MKAVLMSIHPKYCDLIAEGKKTIEVRKTRPKITVPFKCYIYCTKPYTGSTEDRFYIYLPPHDTPKQVNGTVIGEFICDCITGLKAENMIQAYYNNTKETCLTDEEIKQYANNKKLYYWHISNLVIYDKPRGLREFYKPLKYDNVDGAKVIHCGHYMDQETVDLCEYNDGDCSLKGCKELRALYQITKPPQSWCYVEVL